MVTPSTQYTGTATSLGQIQNSWRATVHGQQSGNVIVATSVDASPNTDN